MRHFVIVVISSFLTVPMCLGHCVRKRGHTSSQICYVQSPDWPNNLFSSETFFFVAAISHSATDLLVKKYSMFLGVAESNFA